MTRPGIAYVRAVKGVTLAFDYADGEPLLLFDRTDENDALITQWLDAVKAKGATDVVGRPARARTWGARNYPQGTRCAYCQAPTDNPARDHIVPFSAGGSESYDNIVPACRPCNSRKRDSSLLQFVAAGGIS